MIGESWKVCLCAVTFRNDANPEPVMCQETGKPCKSSLWCRVYTIDKSLQFYCARLEILFRGIGSSAFTQNTRRFGDQLSESLKSEKCRHDTGRTKFLFLSGDIRKCGNYAIKEFTRFFGANIPPSEIEKTINQSLMNAGIKDIGSFEKIFKTMVQLERSKIKR
jgi:hypothetical protein